MRRGLRDRQDVDSPTFGEFCLLRAPATDDRADNQKGAEPGDAVDDREHRAATAECIVGSDCGQDKTEPAKCGGDNAGTHREHVHVHEDAIKHPGDDELTDEHDHKRSALRNAGFGVLFGLALFEGLTLSGHPGFAERGVINATEYPRSNGGNQDRNNVGMRKVHCRLPYFSPPILQTSFHSASVTGCTDRRPYFTSAISLSFDSALTAASVTGLANDFSAAVCTATHASFFAAVGSVKDSRTISPMPTICFSSPV